MKGFIYKVTNKVNNKVYIGQTRYTVEFRWRQHVNSKDNCHFHLALRKYGVDNFLVETLEECDIENLDSREMFYIAKYDSFKNGYNSTSGGTNGLRCLTLDGCYDEIKGLYLSGFSSNKIATIYNVDKATIVKILKQLDVKIRSNKLNINHQEFLELVEDYKNGYSLRELAKRYDCSAPGLKEYLERKGVDLKEKYNILNNAKDQEDMIKDYLDGGMKLSEIQLKYHCSYNTFKKVLSLHGVKNKGKGTWFKLSDAESLIAIKMHNDGKSVVDIARCFNVDKCTIYSLFKRYHVNY